ncbi:MAG: permease-like cell division protein FtsX [Betaproteobacteria bacterium]
MRGWLRDHRRAAMDAVTRLGATPMASLLNILVIGVALSLPVGVYLALSQVQSLTRQVSSDPQISIFLTLDAGDSDAKTIERKLQNDAEIGSFRFIPRSRALADLKRSAGLSDVLNELKQNPLPDAFVVTARDNRPQTLERLRDEAATWPRVAHVQLDSEWARKLDAALRLGRTAVFILGVLLSGALIAITFNTIRLQILTRQEEIEVTKLIGATHPFIRRPFLYFGALQGAAGGLTAWVIVAVAAYFLNRDLIELAALYGAAFQLQALQPRDGLALLFFSAGLGWSGGWLSVSQHLWRQKPI